MLSDSKQCPADLTAVAEAFVMNGLAPSDKARFEEHLLICERCIAAVEDADRYVRSVKVAAQRLRMGKAGAASGF